MNLCECFKDNIYLLASFFVIKSTKSQSLTTQVHLPYIARNTDFYFLSVGHPSNSHLAAYIEALFEIQECYVLDFFIFLGTGTLIRPS